ncbi:MAG: outer membrane protein assembly factor BamA [Treponema sp.]|nr:outer membrane protein assembly factor BamA [Treponema sp.]
MRFKVFTPGTLLQTALIFFIAVFPVFSQEQQDDEWYIGKPIKDIIFTGLKNIKLSELEALVNPYKERAFDESVFWELQGKLYALEYFDRVDPGIKPNPAGTGVVITFTVAERPVISRISFIGHSGLRRNELLDVITTKVSDIFNQAKLQEDITAIKNKYTEKGYPNAVIDAVESKTGESTIAINFQITEGEKISIKSIEFQNIISGQPLKFSNNALKGQLSLKTKSLINDGAFQEAKLIADREAIAKYYHDRGYIDAVVTYERKDEISEKNVNMIITFLINEGVIYTFGKVEFEGNNIFKTDQLDKLINSKSGDTVNKSRLEADLQRVSDLYYENGYIFNSIVRTEERKDQVISYKITIVERSRAYIENILVRGNEKTKSDVILREIPLESGDVFSRTKVMDAMRNLYNLQFFSAVYPETLQGSEENLMDLIFTVEETQTTEVQFGLTFSGSADPDTFPISGMVKINDRNLFGSGNELGAEVNSSVVADTSTASVNYLHRWIFGLPLSGGIDFSANYLRRLAAMNNGTYPGNPGLWYGNEPYAYPDGFHSYNEYQANNFQPPRDYLMEYMQWYISMGFSTGYRWTTFMGNLSVNGGIRFGIVKNDYDGAIFRPFDPALRERNNQWTLKNSFWASVALDKRDIFYDPSRGFYLYQRGGFYGFFNEEREHYIRSDTKAEIFFTLFNVPVTEKWNFKGVFGLHTGLAVLFNKDFNHNGNIPPIEDSNKLSVDGMFVGRGWSSEYRNKGLLLWENWAELRFPVVPSILAFDLFFDAAAVETRQGYYFGKDDEGDSNFTIDNFRFSFGGGFRFTIPQFPFRIGLAKRFRTVDKVFKWEPGALQFGNDSNPARGVDLVISFVLSY